MCFHSLGYLCAKFHFFCGLHCWASPWRKIAYSVNHSFTHPAYLMRREPKLSVRNMYVCMLITNIPLLMAWLTKLVQWIGVHDIKTFPTVHSCDNNCHLLACIWLLLGRYQLWLLFCVMWCVVQPMMSTVSNVPHHTWCHSQCKCGEVHILQ